MSLPTPENFAIFYCRNLAILSYRNPLFFPTDWMNLFFISSLLCMQLLSNLYIHPKFSEFGQERTLLVPLYFVILPQANDKETHYSCRVAKKHLRSSLLTMWRQNTIFYQVSYRYTNEKRQFFQSTELPWRVYKLKIASPDLVKELNEVVNIEEMENYKRGALGNLSKVKF